MCSQKNIQLEHDIGLIASKNYSWKHEKKILKMAWQTELDNILIVHVTDIWSKNIDFELYMHMQHYQKFDLAETKFKALS